MKITYKTYNDQVKKSDIENSIEPLDTDENEEFKDYGNSPKNKSKNNKMLKNPKEKDLMTMSLNSEKFKL